MAAEDPPLLSEERPGHFFIVDDPCCSEQVDWKMLTAPVIFASSMAVMQLLVTFFRQVITTGVLEHASVTSFKVSLRNILSNIGLVSALMLTISIAMLQVVAGPQDNVSAQIYVALCICSVVQSTLGLAEAVIGLVYTEPLSEIDTFKYSIRHAGCVGSPVIYTFTGVMSQLVALSTWIYHEYGPLASLSQLSGALWVGVFIVRLARARDRFDPEDPSIDWTLQSDELPAWIPDWASDKYRRHATKLATAIGEEEKIRLARQRGRREAAPTLPPELLGMSGEGAAGKLTQLVAMTNEEAAAAAAALFTGKPGATREEEGTPPPPAHRTGDPGLRL